MAVMTPSTVKAKTLFKPAMKGNAVASGIVASAELSATRQSYTVPATTLWNSGKFNQQGQKWAAVDSGNAAAGVQNRATGRSQFDAIFYAHITTTEIEFAGTKCDIQVWGTAAPSGKTTGFDLLVWVENGGRMQRVTALPVGGSSSAMQYFNIDFGGFYQGKIKIVAGACLFVGVGHEASAIVRKAADRPFAIADGDSFFESHQSQNAGAPGAELGFYCLNLPTLLEEITGWTIPSRAQGATGFFKNGMPGVVNNDGWGPLSSTRWFSEHRRGWITGNGPGDSDFLNFPLMFILNGTWNDADGGGTTVMYARAKECYQWVVSQDAHIVMAHVSIEPYTGDGAGGAPGAAGTWNGPPTAGSVHHQNLLGHIQAASEVPRTYVINPFGPTDPWFTGKGDTTTLATDPGSQQARLTGSDHIHGNYPGYTYYASRIAEAIGELPIPMARAQRQV